ncbi:MAG: mannose-1-phosphate guanylyltransferase [Prevotella sp.]|nr:mannose-1-phosphate guanylyltransferase [Prevotella sp.]
MENDLIPLENAYCVILAGGKGRRLWPCSRERYPKQFIDFFGSGRTLLQQTYDRLARIIPREHIFINTNQDYTHIVREQLPELEEENLLAEPIHRNTAPSVAWACLRILRQNPEASVIVSPADYEVQNEQVFRENMLEGLRFVDSHDGLLTMGIKPTRPEPGYGYIQLGNPLGDHIFAVQSFTEKPERDFARMFVDSGEFYWNTGLFLSRAKFLKQSLEKLLPALFHEVEVAAVDLSLEKRNELVKQYFPLFPNLSLEHSVLERSDEVYVMKCDFGWADLGTWHSIYEAYSKSDDDNVVINSDVITDDSRNNIIKLSDGRLAIVNGLDGYIVAEHGNVLLICRKEDSSALIRKYINDVQIGRGSEFV